MVATAQTAGPAALALAVVVKLTRVVLLAPVVAGAGLAQRSSMRLKSRNGAEADDDGGKFPPIVPLFVLGFIAMVAVRSVGGLGPGVLDAAGGLQDILLASALFGLGSAVRVRTLLHTGGRAVLVALGSWFLIALLGLGAVLLMIR